MIFAGEYHLPKSSLNVCQDISKNMGAAFSNTPLKDYNPDDCSADAELDLNPFNYPQAGNYKYNEHMSVKEVANLPIEEQLKFSDAICRRYAKNPLFLTNQKDGYTITTSMDGLNTTSIGNMAMMKVSNPADEFWAESYEQLINFVKGCNN